MKTRIISGIIAFIILFTTIFIGGNILNTFILLISLLAINEFYEALKNIGYKINRTMSILFAVSLYIIILYEKILYIQPLIYGYTLTILVLFVLKTDFKLIDVSLNILSTIYIIGFIFHISLLNGNILIWLIFITAWSTDTFAYFTGIYLGKRKLCPNLSPNKTIEGAIGGIIGSLLVTLVFIKLFNTDNILKLSFLSILCSIISQIGDLTASKIKRITGIKDYGNIIPGHGGILDRFDSILFTSPIVYYYIKFIL